MSNLALIIFLLALLTQTIQACLFKAPARSKKEKVLFGPWSDKKVKKILDSSCECGRRVKNGDIDFTESLPWDLDIHVTSVDLNCSGTIITSNLIATSHECIHLPGRKYFLFDAWNTQPSKSKSLASKEDIHVTNPNNPDQSFEVLEIIPHPHFLAQPNSKKYELDLLLLKLNADFTNHPTLKPICLPDSKMTSNAVVGKVAYYQNWVYNDQGTILEKKSCQKVAQHPSSPFCFHAGDGLGMTGGTKTVGGPLILQSFPSYLLVGIADGTCTELAEEDSYLAYFTNIIPLIKYMEYRADEHKSKWCKPASSDESGAWSPEKAPVQMKHVNEPLDCVCGVPNAGLSGRTVGGEEAIPYEFGWMAYLRYFHNGRTGERGNVTYSGCGGAIINDRMVLTAAHCSVRNGVIIQARDVDVFVNTHERDRDAKGILMKVSAVLVHPEFVTFQSPPAGTYIDYDIALLVLEDRLSFPPLPKKGIRPVCLPKMGETLNLTNEMALVAGWGLTDPEDENSFSERLLKLNLPIMSLETCRDVTLKRVTDHFLCAGTFDKSKDSTKGDSGGPLTVMRGQQHTEVGIVSWAADTLVNGELLSPSYYTNVTHPDILSYIDYHAKQVGVRWCKSELPR